MHTTSSQQIEAEQSPPLTVGRDVSHRIWPNNDNCSPSFGPHPNLHCKWDSNNYLPVFSFHGQRGGLYWHQVSKPEPRRTRWSEQKDKGRRWRRKDGRMTMSGHICIARSSMLSVYVVIIFWQSGHWDTYSLSGTKWELERIMTNRNEAQRDNYFNREWSEEDNLLIIGRQFERHFVVSEEVLSRINIFNLRWWARMVFSSEAN